MTTRRRVIDAKDKDGEKVYVKGHAKATYMSDGRTVEDAINAGGGGGKLPLNSVIINLRGSSLAIPSGKVTEIGKRLSDGVEGFWDCVSQTFIEPMS